MKVRAASVVETTSELDIQVIPAPRALSTFFLCFMLLEVRVSEGETISDLIVPTWGLINWRDRPGVKVKFRAGDPLNHGAAGGIGPYDHAVQLEVGPVRQWSAVMLPSAWIRFVGARARDYANQTFPIDGDPAFAAFHSLTETLFGGEPDQESEFARICETLMPVAEQPVARIEERVNTILLALMDAKISLVGDLADHAGITRRTLERTCDEAFGLPPKVLLSRQRFLRSMAQFMANRQGSWSDSIDHLYHDQPQFVREFRKFMGMTPRQFAQLKRPLVEPVLLRGLRYWQEAKRLSDLMGD